MRLTGPQTRRLKDALLNAFSPNAFDNMLLYNANKRRTDITTASGQENVVRDVIVAANYELWVPDLLRAARESNPRDGELLTLAQEFGRALNTPVSLADKQALQRTIRTANPYIDVARWVAQLASIEGQVCRIEVPDVYPPDFGTGFLLGPDVVMTNYHVIEKVHKGHVAPSDVTLRFDYALLTDGVTPNPGTLYKLSEPDWLIDFSEYSAVDLQPYAEGPVPSPDQLDYALLRVTDAPGDQPLGGPANKDIDAPARGWIKLPASEYDFQPDSALFIVQHPKGDFLKLTLDTDAVIGVNSNKTRVRYRTNTEHGSSGSPCFDADWNLIALHHGGDPEYQQFHQPGYNQGIPFSAIVGLLEQRDKKKELGQ